MKQQLIDVYQKINYEDYTLKDIALFFEKYDGYILRVETNTLLIKVKINKYSLPHILGLQHAYAGEKDMREYSGKTGFDKLINHKITMQELKRKIKTNSKAHIAWKNIQRRIEYLPYFLNTIGRRTRLKIVDKNRIARNSKIKGNYALFKEVFEVGKSIYPLLSLKEIGNSQIVIETFIIEDNPSFLGALEEQTIKNIDLVSPLESTYPQNIIKEKELVGL